MTQEGLERFLARNGRRFYKLPQVDGDGAGNVEGGTQGRWIVLERKGERISMSIGGGDGGLEVGLSRGGDEVRSLRWVG